MSQPLRRGIDAVLDTNVMHEIYSVTDLLAEYEKGDAETRDQATFDARGLASRTCCRGSSTPIE